MRSFHCANAQSAATAAFGLLGAAAAIASATTTGCAPAAPRVFGQDAIIRVESDPGVPIDGAVVTYEGKLLVKTSNDGRARLRLAGHDGDTFRVAIGCPEGFQLVGASEVDILVRRAEETKSIPEFSARCARLTRRAVVAIRAQNGAFLPVMQLGREIGRTDASGAATIALDVAPGSDVELVLDTRGQKKIHPQNPVLGFKAPDRDDMFVLDQVFTVDKAPVVRFAPRGPKLPRALGGDGGGGVI